MYMLTEQANPFNITKAVDFSDTEINNYWVDITGGDGFKELAKPTSPMPMLIIGGKGSGKTHLMRYFSYPLQKIRHGSEVLSGIVSDGYLGIYMRCGGLNSARFKGKGQTDDAWGEVFAYYMELWLGQHVLRTVLDALGERSELRQHEADLCEGIASLLDQPVSGPFDTLETVVGYLRNLQRDLDREVNDSAISRSLNVRIAATRGSLIFGIPKILTQHVSPLRSCLFLYLIDEFENLSEPQQKHINTLLREKESPCSFKIGAKLYGVRTFSTYSADEENKEGSEYEVLPLDAILRDNEQYPRFAKRLVARRLGEHGYIPADVKAQERIIDSLDKWFAQPAQTKWSTEETAFVQETYNGRERPYFKSLRQKLEKGVQSHAAPGLRGLDEIPEVIAQLARPDIPVLEKANVFLLYKAWSAGEDLRVAASRINENSRLYTAPEGKAGSDYVEVMRHFKADLLAQLLRDCHLKQRYLGLDTFIDMSWGFPRNLLIMLKHIFSWAVFNGEVPFRSEPISLKAQEAGVGEAADWFYRDAQTSGTERRNVIDSIGRLGEMFRAIRFSDKPAECSCCAFSADMSLATSDARHVLDVARKWSLIIEVGAQRDRNSERVDSKYQLNRMLAPRWDLAIYRRGVLALASNEVNAVFDPACVRQFDSVLQARIERMTAPFFGPRGSNSTDQPHLF